MLNRHILRIKAMQALYAYRQAENSDFVMALDHADARLTPESVASSGAEARHSEGHRRVARALFKEHYLQKSVPPETDALPDVIRAVNEAIGYYHTQRLNDQRRFSRHMLADAEKIYDHYLLVLLLLIELSDMVQQVENERQHKLVKSEPVPAWEFKFSRNPVITLLREHPVIQTESIRRGLGWGNHRDFVRNLYREVLKNDPEYQQYVQLREPAFEDEKNGVNVVARQAIFKSDLATAFFEEMDLNWVENREIVRGMVKSTIKPIQPGDVQSVDLQDLARNWEADRDFFVELYEHAVAHDAEYEKILAAKAENWDVERIAVLDKVILKMAITEMLHFPSIPVKVTINEYIEISKQYSTPKSKQFVNGMLDVIADELTANGTLKKSGRGLIDNK